MTYDPRYGKRWHYARARGILQWIPVDDTRAHVRRLVDQGFSTAAIAKAAGISDSGARDIAGYRPETASTNIGRRMSRMVLSVTPAKILAIQDSPRLLVPSLGAKRRIRALMTLGHTLASMDAAMGERKGLAKYLVDRAPDMSITLDKHHAAERAYRQLWDKPGTSARVRNDARRRGYAPPLAWDNIDDPDEQPQGVGADSGHLNVENIEWFLDLEPTATAVRVAERFGLKTSDAVQQCARRAERQDLLDRLARNAELAGHNVRRAS